MGELIVLSPYDIKVEKWCRRICEKLEINPDNITKIGRKNVANWEKYKPTVDDWFEIEAFRQVKQEFWSEENKKK